MAESIKRGSAPPPLQSPAVPVSVPPSSGGAAKVVNEKMEKQTKDMLRNEGIISNTEEFETLYLAEDEIEKFMEKYLRENPGTEVETRYVNHPPIEMTQNIEVRWLRPETPEIPPIIIREVEQPAEPQKPPLRIVEKRKANSEPEAPKEPLIIREKPPMVAISEPKYAYVQNVIKKEAANPTSSKQQPLKLDASRSTGPITVDSQSTYTNFNNRSSRLDFEGQRSERDMNYSYEEHASVIDYDEEEIDLVYGRSRAHARHHLIEDEDLLEEEKYRIKQQQQQQQQSHQRSYEDEHQLRLYEEKLKKTLYEEYLLRLERERLEKKLSKSGLLEERIRERSISQDRLSHLRDGALREHNKYRTFRERERLIAAARERERDLNEMMMMRHHIIRERQTQSFDMSNSDTSSYKNIKFAKVTDEHDLNRLTDILNNPNSQILCSKADADKIASSLADIDTIIDTSFVNQESIIIDNNHNNHHNNPNNNHNFNSNSATNHTHIHSHLNNHNNCNNINNNNNNSHLNNHNNSNNNRTRHNNHKEQQNSNNTNNNNYNIHHHHQYHAPIIRNSHKYTDGIANINELASDRRTTRIIQGSSANNFIKNYSDRSSSDLENSHTAIEVEYSLQQHQHQPQQRKTHPHTSQKHPSHQAASAKQQQHQPQQKQHHHHHHQQVPQTHKSHASHHYDDLYMNGSSSASPPPSSAAPTLIQDSSSSAYKSNDTASSNVTKHRVTKIHSYYHTTNYPNNEKLNNIYITKY